MNYLGLHRYYLDVFWNQFGGLKNRRGVSPHPKEFTLKVLVYLGTIELKRSSKARTPLFNRSEFEKRKNLRRRYKGFTLCFACKAEAEVRHHIIWLRNGGRNNKRNVLALCRDCHAVIHPWLNSKIISRGETAK